MTNSIGRPKKELDWKVLDSILQFGATLIDCAEMCEMSDDSIQRRIKDEYGCTFTEYRNRKMSRMRVKLLQKQYESAMAGNTALLIWLGKQHLGQSDKTQHDISDDSKEVLKLAYAVK
jgi:AraC-like DNA-binding protein